ncbi:hypothetical protein [Dyella silvatica]|uniref:hypothetical protein n=1 Tax=Dyella silvatica TaxID=2992128 RepID=UPI00224FEC4A|nr:hypothetical protein [Dyella silvatica]
MGLHTSKICGLMAISILVAGCNHDDAADSIHTADAKSPGVAAASVPAPLMLPWDSSTVTAFNGDPGTIPLAGKCSLEGINGVAPTAPLPAARAGLMPTGAVAQSGSDAVFNGWMGDADGQVPANALFVLQGPTANYAVKVAGGGARPDVAKVLGSDGLATSGYVLKTKLLGVVPGDYRLWLVYGTTESISACKVYSTLRITADSAG